MEELVEDRQEGPLEFAHVVVPLDGSPLALAALPTAQAVAARFGAQLAIVAVASDDRDARRLRDRVLESVDEDERDHVEVVVAPDAAEAIVELARQREGSIVCMSTSGRGRVSGALIGSVARSVLEISKAHVLVVGPQADRPDALVGRPRRRPARWPEPLAVGGVLACVDGSRSDQVALSIAARWAATLERELRVLTVAEDAAVDPSGRRPNRFGPDDPSRYVDELVADISGTGPTTIGEVVWDPISVASGIEAYLARREVALLVLATHARSGFERLRLGATAADIVRTSTQPVLVIPVADPS